MLEKGHAVMMDKIQFFLQCNQAKVTNSSLKTNCHLKWEIQISTASNFSHIHSTQRSERFLQDHGVTQEPNQNTTSLHKCIQEKSIQGAQREIVQEKPKNNNAKGQYNSIKDSTVPVQKVATSMGRGASEVPHNVNIKVLGALIRSCSDDLESNNRTDALGEVASH